MTTIVAAAMRTMIPTVRLTSRARDKDVVNGGDYNDNHDKDVVDLYYA